jgi:hypothetical protein
MSAAATAADATSEASHHKARKLERELKKLDSSWNPTDELQWMLLLLLKQKMMVQQGEGNRSAFHL